MSEGLGGIANCIKSQQHGQHLEQDKIRCSFWWPAPTLSRADPSPKTITMVLGTYPTITCSHNYFVKMETIIYKKHW